ncbi:histidine phosphatase superfamily [Crucibulum laeve]|uniref:Histidine phosphatase superfamily n=1 Tax=Crucibulum laeve TaxID=68775 RepID=A0A5C3M5Y0_9AGAR|nr:histidine phosphatase superfamily [Crucibulum laeve]
MAVKFTLIRHGESIDNLKNLWAGWKDATLSNHGMFQAECLASSLASTPFTEIYASDLKRALLTAQALQSSQLSRLASILDPTTSTPTSVLAPPPPKLHITELLREQHFGAGEGKPFVSKDPELSLHAHYAKGKFPALYGRSERFPGGESLCEVRARAERAVDEVLWGYISQLQEEFKAGEEKEVHVAVVSHGIFIPELIMALLKCGGEEVADIKNYRGMKNTAWSRVVVNVVKDEHGAAVVTQDGKPKLKVAVTSINRHEHLDKLVRQKGGIGRVAYDPGQKDIRAFFAGEGKAKRKEKGKPY